MLAIPDECTKYNYASITQINPINLDMEYADDVSKESSNYLNYNDIRKIKDEVPKVQLSRGLQLSNTKTEERVINKESNSWKNVNYLVL